MAIRFRCGECGKTLSVKEELTGKRVKCPCGAVVVARAAAGPAAAAVAARPSTSAGHRATASRAGGTRPAALAGRPTANPYAVGGSDLSSLFDELTESDLKPRGNRSQSEGEGDEPKKDPLAAYTGDARATGSKRAATSGSRPSGLVVLAVLNFLVAVAGVGLGVVIISGAQLLGDLAEQVPLLKTSATILGVITLGVGIFYGTVGAGLLIAKPWGWWLGATAYAYNVTDRIFGLVFGIVAGDAGAAAAKGAIGIGVALWILGYLYNEEVRQHFGVKTKPAIAVSITLGAMTVLAFAIHVGFYLMFADGAAE